MWQEAKANDRRIKELMSDHKKRAERRRAYYESRLGDPQQLIRVIGSSSKLYPDAEQFYYHDNPENLMPWQGNPDIKIDRFDGRSLLDFVPDTRNQRGYQDISKDDREMKDELNFERYHDLIEAERLNVTESERLAEVEEEWTKLLDRHQAKLALLKNQEKSNTNSKNRSFGFDYGTNKANEEDLEENDEEESKLLKEVDILQYVDDLTDKDKQALNEMSGKYGIKSYARLLRVAKKDRDEELRSLKRRQEEGKPKEGTRNSRRRSNERRRRRRRRRDRDYEQGKEGRYRRRYSPTYEPYGQGSEGSGSSMSEDDEDDDLPKNDNSDFVIEFGSNTADELVPKKQQVDENDTKQRPTIPVAPIEKKLTPMEKLKLKMRAGLEKQIVSDEKDKRQKEKAKEIENLQELARNQGLPINTYLRPEPPQRQSNPNASTLADGKTRYRSPSSDGSASPKRSPSSRSDNRRYSRSPSSSPTRKRSRSRDREPSSNRRRRSRSNDRTRSININAKNRSLSREKRHHYSSSSRDHRRPRSRSRSPPSSSRRSRYRSPSEDRGRSRKYSRRHSRSRSPRRHDRGSSRR